MSRGYTVYTVFLSGPSDVDSELEIIAQVIDDINILLQHIDIQFKTFHWRKDVTPGVSGVDAQQRINEQSEGYDIIVAAFAAKLGTPTVRFPSGTVEELSIALLKRNSLQFRDDSIMLFFKRIGLDSITADLRAAADLQEYRRSLPVGVLYKEFDDEEDLRSAVLRAFAPIIRHLLVATVGSANPATLPEKASEGASGVELPTSDEPLGLLDHVEVYEQGMAGATAYLGVIQSNIASFTEFLQAATTQLTSANANEDRASGRIVIDKLAEHMSATAQIIAENTSRLRAIVPQAIESLSLAIEIQTTDFNQPSSTEKRDLISLGLQLAESAESAIPGISGLKEAVTGTPRVTKDYNNAKRALILALEQLIAFLEATAAQGRDMAGRIG